ncbi:MAG: carboxypeptidase regulatory-like domain-containing protein [Bryobacteraceae bacterium]
MHTRTALLLPLVYLLASTGLWAQGTTSRLVGVVQDPSGAAVASATVRLTNEGTNVSFKAATSESGAYVFEALQSGLYTVEVEAAGFRKFVSRRNQVSIGQPTTVNVTLEVGALTEQVTVADSMEAVQTSTSGNMGNLFQGDVIRDLPIVGTRGRNPLSLVLLQPGVVEGGNTGGLIHVHGARDRAWNYTLDGVDVNDTSAGGSNSSPLRTNPDSIEEFRVLTSNTTAEYGRNSGGQVAMITRSGTNDFHGTGFWFYRTPRINANEWEYNVDSIGKRQFVQHIYGGSLGGPVIKNKTFFFTNLQFLKALETASISRTVYTAEARRGILRYVKGGRNRPAGVSGASVDPSGNVLPGISIGAYNLVTSDPDRLGFDPTIQKLVGETPLPNSFMGGDGLNTALYTFAAAQKENQHDVTFKIDQIINDKNTVFARIAFGVQDTLCDRTNGGSPMFPGMPCVVNTSRTPRNLAFNWRINPSPSVTNELVVGHNQFTYDFPTVGQGIDKISLYGPVEINANYAMGNKRTLKTLQFVDNLSWFRGSHALKFGANLRLQQHVDTRGSVAGYNVGQEVNFSTSVNTVDPATFGIPADVNTTYDRPAFQTHINFLLGRVGSITRAFVDGGGKFVSELYHFDARYPEYDFYAQDSWKIRKNLTIDLGLRWEIKLTPTDADGRVTHPDRPMVAGAAPGNTVRWVKGNLFDSAWKNLGPSIGLAWDPTGKGKTSLRGNYRLAFDRLNTFVLSSAVFQNLPGSTWGTVNTDFGQRGGRLRNMPVLTPPAVSPGDLTLPPAFSSSSITVVDPSMKVPATHQWALDLQREILPRTVLNVSYIGRRAYHLFGAYNANQAEIFRNGFISAFNTVKAGGESDLINRLTVADSRRGASETGSQMIRRLYASDLNQNSVAAIAGALATRIQGGRSVTDLSGAGPFALIPFPQFSGGTRVIDSNDFSTYHALEIQVEKRFSSGFSYQASYTWAKSLDTRSFDPAFTVYGTGNAQSAGSTPFDINNRGLNYARSDFDRTHAFQSNWVLEFPFGRGRRWANNAGPMLDKLIGGWEVAGFMRWTSGRPMTVYSGSYTFSNVVQSPANCTGCRGFGRVYEEGGMKWFLNGDERSKYSIPAAGELGSSGRNAASGPTWFNIDATFLKRIRFTERWNLELRADTLNLTNTPSFGLPTLTYTSTTFGRIRNTVSSYSRKVQLGMKLNF